MKKLQTLPIGDSSFPWFPLTAWEPDRTLRVRGGESRPKGFMVIQYIEDIYKRSEA
jgi:hypothetical protein